MSKTFVGRLAISVYSSSIANRFTLTLKPTPYVQIKL
ncbi:hypothetical protein FHT21_000952 [Pedobacter sp. SG908]|nr:hypothetical protein [Pedobacter sp. SG908]NMN35910.1 hypothetical protein [Pedobacter sp. SG918]